MKILLAVDSSTASDTAVREVAARPWPQGSTVLVLSVAESAHISDAPELLETLQNAARQVVDHTAAVLRHSGLLVETMVLTGDPRGVIIDLAATVDVDLIAIGSHEVRGLTGVLLGSVAKAVTRFAPCSVEIVRAQISPMARRILLATDGSESSEIAARSVAARPWPVGTEIRVLSVVELSIPILTGPYFETKAMEELRGKAMKHAEEAVMSAEQILFDAGLQASGTEAVPSATPKELILQQANEWGADLIVVGSHGRRGLSRFLLGSVSEAVALHAACSVEIIRQTKVSNSAQEWVGDLSRFDPDPCATP